jgi:SAM-dependent methyltransferase
MDRIEIYNDLSLVTDDQVLFYKKLRGLSVDVVADLMLGVPAEYEAINDAIPKMASDEIQKNWNGSSGYSLLVDSCAYIRTLESGINRFSGRSMDNAKILDFGCGWGRLIRLLYKFTAPENIYGCDPWDQSLKICEDDGIKANLAKSDYLPKDLPFPDVKFDFIYAYSVFTHLSEKAALAAVSACRKHIKDDGLLVITVRPKSYWEAHQPAQNHRVVKEDMISDHESKGFAFTAHGPNTPAQVDGEITYGDTSITLKYIADNWKEWEVVGTEHFLQDQFQMLVFLKPKSM